MISIIYQEVIRNIHQGTYDNTKVLISGETSTGKTEIAKEFYSHLIEDNNESSNNILVFTLNSSEMIKWKYIQNYKFYEGRNIFSYQVFIKNEIKKFWPYIVNKIDKNTIKPTFISQEIRAYLIETIVEYFREKKGYFNNITSSVSQISFQILESIDKAACSMIPYEKIGERIYNSSIKQDLETKLMYTNMQQIINHYIKTLIASGTVDSALCMYYYNNILLKDERYIKHLVDSYNYIIIDNFEYASPCEVYLLDIVKKNLKGCLILYNPEVGFSGNYGQDNEYIKTYLKEQINFKTINLEKNLICNPEMINFSKALDEKIKNTKLKNVNVITSFQLRNSMICEINNIIKNYASSKKSLKDIAIIIPFIDGGIINNIKKIAEPYKWEVYASSREMYGRERYVRAMLVAAYLCGKIKSLPEYKDSIVDFFSIVFNIDYINAYLMAKKCIVNDKLIEIDECNIDIFNDFNIKERYEFIKLWIEKEKNDDIPIGFFIRKLFIEIFAEDKHASEIVYDAQYVSQICQDFFDVMKSINLKKDYSCEVSSFLYFNAIKSEDYRVKEKLLSNVNKIIITTPEAFITSYNSVNVEIWVDFFSRGWIRSYKKELSNKIVLQKSWNENEKFTDEIDEVYIQKSYNSKIKSLIQKCSDEIYILGSTYSLNGFEQNNAYAEEIIEIIGN